jgi:hypothetical protein
MVWLEIVESTKRRGVSVSLDVARRNRFPGVLLHLHSLAFEFSASCGAMSRRSGFAA